MATITAVPIDTNRVPGVHTVVWLTLTEADTAAGYIPGSLQSLAASMQIVGTWGGGVVELQGSNDGTNWVSLKDVNGTAMSLSADGGFSFGNAFKWIRPHATTAGTGRDVDVYLTFRF